MNGSLYPEIQEKCLKENCNIFLSTYSSNTFEVIVISVVIFLATHLVSEILKDKCH